MAEQKCTCCPLHPNQPGIEGMPGMDGPVGPVGPRGYDGLDGRDGDGFTTEERSQLDANFQKLTQALTEQNIKMNEMREQLIVAMKLITKLIETKKKESPPESKQSYAAMVLKAMATSD